MFVSTVKRVIKNNYLSFHHHCHVSGIMVKGIKHPFLNHLPACRFQNIECSRQENKEVPLDGGDIRRVIICYIKLP